jgi:hypothetical protein
MPSIYYLGVLVSAIVVFAIGALWYSPMLFGRQWVAAHGFTPEKMAEMKQGMGKAYGITFGCYLVLAAVMNILINRMLIGTAVGGVKLGAIIWLGFAATIGLTANVFSEKRFAVYAIDTAYQLVYLIAVAVILAVWR